jgi:hypothetical protein
MLKKPTKRNVRVFSKNQFAVSVVPRKELAQTMVKVAMKAISHGFLDSDVRFFEMARVNGILRLCFINNEAMYLSALIPGR